MYKLERESQRIWALGKNSPSQLTDVYSHGGLDPGGSWAVYRIDIYANSDKSVLTHSIILFLF